jgi:predicted AAA+ superfamily ATPase
VSDEQTGLLRRIAEALERIAPPQPAMTANPSPGYVWQRDPARLVPVDAISGVTLDEIRHVDRQRDALLANLRRFVAGRSANNVLLWGARGTGKSSLVKAVHNVVRDEAGEAGTALSLVQVDRDDLADLPALLRVLRDAAPTRFVVFCDDLSFDGGESGYKSLKSVLDGGLLGYPANVMFAVTSNRRHLLARDIAENERATAINPGEAIEEKLSLADRFGLSLGFYPVDMAQYLSIVTMYAEQAGLELPADDLARRATLWATERGARSGRAATQLVRQLAAEHAEMADV